MAKKPALGRGLGSLISSDEVVTSGSSSINEINITKIIPNPDQPRKKFDEATLEELSLSIKQLGVIQPITLREVDNGNYQIIAGERRFKASKLAGLQTIPAYVRTAKDGEVMEMALIENIQRDDLNSIEVALTYQKLIDYYNLTQEQLSERVGKKRATITNYLRLLKLPAEIQMGLKEKKIDMAHARAIIGVEDVQAQLSIYELILEDDLPVRKVEEYVKAINEGSNIDELKNKENIIDKIKNKKSKGTTLEEYQLLKEHLSKFFKTKIQLTCNESGKGKISIPFKSEEELEKIITIFDQLK